MAKDVTGWPWVFDAQDQAEGWGPDQAGTTVNFDIKPYIQQIKVVTGATGGDVLITQTTGGKHVMFGDEMPANDVQWWPIYGRVDGLLMETLPSEAVIYVYHGEP